MISTTTAANISMLAKKNAVHAQTENYLKTKAAARIKKTYEKKLSRFQIKNQWKTIWNWYQKIKYIEKSMQSYSKIPLHTEETDNL